MRQDPVSTSGQDPQPTPVHPERSAPKAREVEGRSPPAAALHALRPHHWVKNVLVFVPLALAHRVNEPRLVLDAVLAFLSFGCAASAVYVLNDLVDV
ncbi:MAG TPA: hypothetical protein VD838_01385, partial [Anaeromyxobacteraceae bacterium]|nr:hypothetical protein [Anaeromyxobacteraceae bacterium]